MPSVPVSRMPRERAAVRASWSSRMAMAPMDLAADRTADSPAPRLQPRTSGSMTATWKGAPNPPSSARRAGSRSGPARTSSATCVGTTSCWPPRLSRSSRPTFASVMRGEALTTHTSPTASLFGVVNDFLGRLLERRDAVAPERVNEFSPRDAGDLSRPALADAAHLVPLHRGRDAQLAGECLRVLPDAGQGSLVKIKCDVDHVVLLAQICSLARFAAPFLGRLPLPPKRATGASVRLFSAAFTAGDVRS